MEDEVEQLLVFIELMSWISKQLVIYPKNGV